MDTKMKLRVSNDFILDLAAKLEADAARLTSVQHLVDAVFCAINLKRDRHSAMKPEHWPALYAALRVHFAEKATVNAERETTSGAATSISSTSYAPSFHDHVRPVHEMIAALPIMLRAIVAVGPLLDKGNELALLPSHAGRPDVCSRSFTKRQCFGILSAAFFCFFQRRSVDCMSDTPFPSINFDEMHAASVYRDSNCVEMEKLRMHLDYFVETAARIADGDARLDAPSHAVTFVRTKASSPVAVLAAMPNAPLAPCELHPLGESIDDQWSMLRGDFANAVIGGASLSFGCVQEEIMFTICPEMNVSRLICTPMDDDEAILIFRAERYSSVKEGTYGLSLAYGGKYDDLHSVESAVSAIDAMDFRSMSRLAQYTPDGVTRELVKAAAGFAFDTSVLPAGLTVPREVATGNWGCGVFGGNSEVKLLEQWVACSLGGRTMHYFPFSDRGLASNFPPLHQRLVDARVTTKWLAEFLTERMCECVLVKKTPFEMLHVELDKLAAAAATTAAPAA